MSGGMERGESIQNPQIECDQFIAQETTKYKSFLFIKISLADAFIIRHHLLCEQKISSEKLTTLHEPNKQCRTIFYIMSYLHASQLINPFLFIEFNPKSSILYYIFFEILDITEEKDLFSP